jgi:hypothetical protein
VNRATKSLLLFAGFVVIFAISHHVAIQQQHTATTSTTTTSTTTSTTTLAKCQGSDFTSVDNGGQGAAGTAYDSVTMTKTTPGTCIVDGYPLLTLQDEHGSVVPSVLTDATSATQFPTAGANAPAAALRVAKGATIGFSYSFSDVSVSGSSCPTIKTINVQFAPQGSSSAVSLLYGQTPCNNGALTISPFYLA